MRVGDDAASAATVRQLDACCLDWHDGATHAGTGDVRTKCGLAVKSQCSCYESCVERYFRVDVYRQIRCRNASLGIVGVNSYPLDQYRQQLASAGAQGLFSRRDIFSPAFAKAIREVASGKRADCPGDFLSARESYEHLRIVSEKDERIISKRELNILSMYTKGLTTEEIGKYLNISCGTALSHVHHASKKLGVSKRIEAIRFCPQHHLIQE